MEIGEAIKAMKLGKRVARTGWNGKNMYLYYVHGHDHARIFNIDGNVDDYQRYFTSLENMTPYQAFIVMRTAQNTLVPWLASQSDLLAEDWVEVEMPEVTSIFYG
jgi:hypothetical protein